MEGEPVSIINSDGCSPIVLMCDHASPAIPTQYEALGLPPEIFDQHIAYDIGARDMTLELVERLDASAIVANFSRLLIDPNRERGQSGFVPEVSDGTIIPGNIGLSQAEIGERHRTYHEPFHDAVTLQLGKVQRSGLTPIVVGVHSFTPIMQGAGRPWQVGLLWNRDPRLAVRMLDWLRRDPHLTVGDNEPYSGRVLGHSMDLHGGSNGFANVVLEVRQDLIATPDHARQWGKLVADALQEITQDRELFGIAHY